MCTLLSYPVLIIGLIEECTDYPVSWANTWKVDLIDELDGGWLIGVLVATVHFQRVDTVLMDALQMLCQF